MTFAHQLFLRRYIKGRQRRRENPLFGQKYAHRIGHRRMQDGPFPSMLAAAAIALLSVCLTPTARR